MKVFKDGDKAFSPIFLEVGDFYYNLEFLKYIASRIKKIHCQQLLLTIMKNQDLFTKKILFSYRLKIFPVFLFLS